MNALPKWKGTKLMGQFLGWASYDISYYCPYCDEFYEQEDEHEHENCDDIINSDDDGMCEKESAP